MWNSIRTFIHFCRLAFNERFPTGWGRRLRRAFWSVLVFVFGFVVSDYLGVPLKTIIAPIYNLLPGLVWLVVVLLLMIGMLLLVMEGARRYHMRIVAEILNATEKAFVDHKTQSTRIERLTLLEGRYLSLYLLLDLRTWPGNSGPPLLASEIQYQEANLFNTLSDYYGSHFRDNYFDELRNIPEQLSLQRDRMERHYASLERHIKSATVQRQAKLEEAARERIRVAANVTLAHDALQKVGSMRSSKMD